MSKSRALTAHETMMYYVEMQNAFHNAGIQKWDDELRAAGAKIIHDLLYAPKGFANRYDREEFIKEKEVDLKDFGEVKEGARKGGVLEYDTKREEITELGDRWVMVNSKGLQFVFHLNVPSEALSLAAVGRRLNVGPTTAYLDYCGVGVGDHEGWKCSGCKAVPPDGANMMLMLAAAPL